MSAVKPTPTPWSKRENVIYGPDEIAVATALADGVGRRLGDGRPNAARIVACVNGCEGIADPSVVPELIAALEGMLAEEPTHFSDEDGCSWPRTDPPHVALARAVISRARGGGR